MRVSTDFDSDTAVHEREPGVFHAVVHDRWTTDGGHANGGYALSICLQALRLRLQHPDPLAVSAFFQRRVPNGPVQVVTEAARSGRRLSAGEARLMQDGKELVRVVASFTDLAAAAGRTEVTPSPPRLPPPADCVDLFGYAGPNGVGIAGRLQCRAPELPGWQTGKPGGRAHAEFWMRFADGREADTLSLPGMVDMTMPAVFDLGEFSSTTIELTVHVRARPVPGWLACRVSTNFLMDGYHDEDFEIWDSSGQLVAQSRQLALLG